MRLKLREMRPKREKSDGYAMMPYRAVPGFVAELRRQPGIAALALEFTILSASRTGETLGAVWSEFDLDAGTWTIPKARMKAGVEHVVFLPPRAIAICRHLAQLGEAFVFPSPTLDDKPLSNMGMLTVLRRMGVADRTTVHGFRKSFSTWANETGAGRPDVIEACLAHQENNAVRAAYNRAEFRKERKVLLAAWAEFLDGRAPASNVLEFPEKTAALQQHGSPD